MRLEHDLGSSVAGLYLVERAKDGSNDIVAMPCGIEVRVSDSSGPIHKPTGGIMFDVWFGDFRFAVNVDFLMRFRRTTEK